MKCLNGQLFRGFASTCLIVLVFFVMGIDNAVDAQVQNDGQASVIAPQLLEQVDYLLGINRSNHSVNSQIPLGGLARQADPSYSMQTQLLEPTQETLNVTAVPLPDAFGMGTLLLVILLSLWLYHRKQIPT